MDFFGLYEHRVDGKGRLVLPAPFRAGFSGGGFLAPLGRNAGLFPPTAWEQYRRRLENSGNFDREALAYVYSLVSQFEPDNQNRIGVPNRLRDKVGIDTEVALVGAGSYVALWDKRAWDSLEGRVEADTDEGVSMEDRFDTLGFL